MRGGACAKLCDAGFSGVDQFNGDQPDDRLRRRTSVVSRAGDDVIMALRNPLGRQ